MLDSIMEVIDQDVKPQLSKHNGDLEVCSFIDGVLEVRFKGQCAGCPSSKFTLEELVESTLREKIPQVKSVKAVDSIPEDAYLLAKRILGKDK